MQDFTKGNVSKQLLAFSLPMLIGNIFQQVYNMSDAVVVGRFIGGDALAAVGTSGPLLSLLLAVIFGLTTGSSVLISQFYGANQPDELRRAVSTSILFMGGLTLMISVVGVIFTPVFLRWMSVPEALMADATAYMRILMAGCLFPLFYNIYTAYLRALGDSRNPLYILIFATVLNVALDLLFVLVFHFGVAGNAFSTVLAQSIAAVLCYVYAKRSVPMLHINKLVFDRALFRSLLRYSVPAAIQLSLVSLAALTIQELINSFGSISMAGYTAATRIDSFATMPVSSISAALAIFVGQNMGAGLEKRAKQGLYSAMALMVGVSVTLSLLSFFFGEWLIAAFVGTADANAGEIVAVGTRYLNIIVIFYTLFAVFFAFNGFFRGVGDAVIVMALTIISLSLRSISARLLNAWTGMGPEAVAWAIPVGWGLCSLIAWIYYRRRMWAGKLAKAVKQGSADSAEALEAALDSSADL